MTPTGNENYQVETNIKTKPCGLVTNNDHDIILHATGTPSTRHTG